MREIVWYNVMILAVWHMGFMYASMYVLPTCSWFELAVLWWGLWYWSGLGITAGTHRLWSHKSYAASRPLRWFLMCMNCMAFQGSILEWSRDHRTHHKGSETNADPHNASRGFFFAHCGWIMVRKHDQVKIQGKKINLQDLYDDQVVMFQHRHYLSLALVWCYVLPTLFGVLVTGGSWTKGFWIAGVFRHVWVLHMTWCVNSVAHFWGTRPYAPDINPAENWFVSLCAIGEGWHNYHHAFPSDYATGEFGVLSGQWNPTTLFIDACTAMGWAWDLKRSKLAAARREKLALQLGAPKHPTTWRDSLLDRLFFGRAENEMFL